MIVSKRHKRSALKTKVVKRIADIPADDWNRVYPDVLESYDFFRAVDESSLGQFSVYYVMVYNGKTPVGATTFFITDYPLDTSIMGPLKRITNSIKKIKPGIFNLRAAVCGIPMGQGRMGIAGNSGEVSKVIFRRLEQIARKNKAAVIAFKDFDRTYAGMLDPLRKGGFRRLDSLPNTELDIRHRDFEGYLKTLSGASRYDLRRKFKKVESSVSIDMKVVDSLDEKTLHDVYRLYLDIIDRHEMGFEVLPIEFFRNISSHMHGRIKFFLWTIDGKLVTFLFAMVSKDKFVDYYVGFDYSVAHRYHLYFIKFRDALTWVMNNGIKRYEMGIMGYEPKRRLGFDFIPLYLYVKLRNRALRPIFNLMCQFLKFENFDPDLRQAKAKIAPNSDKTMV